MGDPGSLAHAAATSDRRVVESPKLSSREARFVRVRFAAEFDHPTQRGRVCRLWFDTRQEALQALKHRSPWDNRPREREAQPWLL